MCVLVHLRLNWFRLARHLPDAGSWAFKGRLVSVNNHIPSCALLMSQSKNNKPEGGQCACCQGRKWRGEDCLISFSRETTRFPFFHTQLHLLLQVHFTEHVHREAQRCTNKQKHSRKTSAFWMERRKKTICVFVLTWINCFMGCEIELATWHACKWWCSFDCRL